MLAPRMLASAPVLPARSGCAAPIARGSLVRVNADRAKVTREFREDSGEVVDAPSTPPPQTPDANQPLYADQVQQSRPRPKDNMSRDMKAKLKQEYLGWGGSSDTAHLPNPRQRVVVAVTSVEEVEAPAAAPSTAPAPKAGSSKWVIDPNEQLKSTWEHRAWTWGPMALMGATLYQGFAGVDSVSEGISVAAALAFSYVLSDLGTGIYHWGVDNYGDGQTPVFGRQIAAFQGHHQRPWTITEREFCNNVHQVFKPAAYPAGAFLLISPFAPPAWNAFASSFLFLICMSQQFHAWSHMKKSELPALVVDLQDRGVLISRKMHGAHHRSPFEGNYCIVSGLWNPLLDSTSFFRGLEKFFHATTGVEPRCWHEPEYEWRELERPTSQ